MSESVKFDRAADYYDATRALSPEARAAVTEMLVAETRNTPPVLEIGVGTGRIALPLHERGVPIAGIDLSVPMLRRLVGKAGGSAPFPLAVADARLVPANDDSFGSAITCHVLHLIPDWRMVAEEIVRVVRPGGVFLNEMGDWGRHPLYDIIERWAGLAGIELTHLGANTPADVDDAMIALGARPRALPKIKGPKPFTPAGIIESLTEGKWSCTWRASEDARRAASEELLPWLRRQFDDITATIPYEEELHWRAYDLP